MYQEQLIHALSPACFISEATIINVDNMETVTSPGLTEPAHVSNF